MKTPSENTTALVYLPAVSGGRLTDPSLRRWLSQADLSANPQAQELLASVLAKMNLPCPDEGLGALRMWGQTGDRPTVWIAAADPVYLEPRLNHLCLHSLGKVPSADLRPLFDHLQDALAAGATYGFARVGSCGYLRANDPIATAKMPAYMLDGKMPNDYMPSGDGTEAFRSLVSEIELSLHDHEVNVRREHEGLQPMNSLWFWGGGCAPEQCSEPRPTLFADDPLLRGYWYSHSGIVGQWPGGIAACLEAAVADVVAIVPAEDDPDLLRQSLLELREALRTGRLSRLTLVFRDGVEASISRKHAWRFWRRCSALLE